MAQRTIRENGVAVLYGVVTVQWLPINYNMSLPSTPTATLRKKKTHALMHSIEGNNHSLRSFASKSFPDEYWTGGRVHVRILGSSEHTRWFSQMTPDEHPRRNHLADGPLSSREASSLGMSSFGAASVMMCCSARPACSSAPSVLSEVRISRNIIYTA